MPTHLHRMQGPSMSTRARQKRKHHPLTHAEILAKLHPMARPRLDSDQCRDLMLLHVNNLDALARGDASIDTLFQASAGLITWIAAAKLEGFDTRPGREHAKTLCELWQQSINSERITCTPDQIDVLRAATLWSDAVAEAVSQPNAVRAANQSEAISSTAPMGIHAHAETCAAMAAWLAAAVQSLTKTGTTV